LVFVAHFYILKKLWMNNLITASFRRTHKFQSLRDLPIRSDIIALTLNPAQSAAQVTATGLDSLTFSFKQPRIQRRTQD